MPRGINGEYYNYRMPFGGNYSNPLISIYNTIIHSIDNKNPYLITGIAPSGSINRTSNFFKFINSSPVKTSIKNFRFNSQQLKQLELLRQNGVITKGITPDHLNTAFNLRQRLIKQTAPNSYNMHYMPGVTSNNSKIVGIDNHKIIGDIDLITNNKTGYSHIGMVRNLSQGIKKGIQERMTNSAIQVNKSLNGKGVVSGETLLSPEKTSKMYPKYKDKKLLGNFGEWQWNKHNPNMQNVDNGPVYLLKTGTYQTPTKSILFNPNIIDGKGTMHIDWNNLDIFKSLTPIIGSAYVYKKSRNINR